jgi:hypothetical protein
MSTTPKRKQDKQPAKKEELAVIDREDDHPHRPSHVEHQEWRGEGVVGENHTD